jgi:hypothetical protein
MLKYSSVQSAAIGSRTWCLTTTIPDRMEFAVDQLFDDLPSPIVGLSLDRIEMASDATWRAASDF